MAISFSCRFLFSAPAASHQHLTKTRRALLLPLSAAAAAVSSTSACSTAATARRSPKAILSEHSLKVPSFGGSLWVPNSPFNVRIRPLGGDYPHLDQAFVKLLYAVHDDPQSEQAKIKIKQEGHKLTVTGEMEASPGDSSAAPAFDPHVLTDVQIPIVHNVNVSNVGRAAVDIADLMESDYCHIKSEAGDITAARIRTKNLSMETDSGDIVLDGNIQGNIKISSVSGAVIAEKRFTGPSLDINTESGDIRVASSYAEQASFTTQRGSMKLRNVHNESYIAIYEQGDLTMIGIDGATNVFVKKGEIECQVSQITHESRIHSEEGDIVLKIADSFPLKVSIDADEIIPDLKFKAYGTIERKDHHAHYSATIKPDKFSPSLHVIAENGRVIVESQDWAASLGFKLPMQKDTSKTFLSHTREIPGYTTQPSQN